MYRITQESTRKPLIINSQVISDYSENRVDYLHTKNLLLLGEDRYLTTYVLHKLSDFSLLLKHHPRFKTKFIRDAQAWTTAPEQWGVFLSQRRRWINSTIHNFLVLFSVPGLCGFCCFSMRFIVMLDLISTILQPVVVIYIGYIVYLLASHSDVVPITSLLMLAAIYGLQAIIFILRRKWEMVGYLMIYILAIPVYSFALPLHAFWNMDKFSWYVQFRSVLTAGVPLASLKGKEVKPSSSPTKVDLILAPFRNANGTNINLKTWRTKTSQDLKSQVALVDNPCEQVCLSQQSIKEVVSHVPSINKISTITHLGHQIIDHLDGVHSQGNHSLVVIHTLLFPHILGEKF